MLAAARKKNTTWKCNGSCNSSKRAGDRSGLLLRRSARKPASQLDFERAAALHKKVEKLDEVFARQAGTDAADSGLDAVILQRAAEEQTIGVYGVRGGRLAEPFFLRFAEIASQPRSAEQIFREHF